MQENVTGDLTKMCITFRAGNSKEFHVSIHHGIELHNLFQMYNVDDYVVNSQYTNQFNICSNNEGDHLGRHWDITDK